MSSPPSGNSPLHAAAGGVVGATGVPAVARNCAVARTAAGTYTLTLDQELDAAACAIVATQRLDPTTALWQIGIVHTSDQVKTVLIRGAADALVDHDFDAVAFRLAA